MGHEYVPLVRHKDFVVTNARTNAKGPFLRAGAALALFPLIASVPYALLVRDFGYDDVLRAPPLDVLRAFAAGGPDLILEWLAFAVCASGFVLVAGLVADAAKQGNHPPSRFVLAAGALSALAQAIGLSRWAFAVPTIADAALDPASSEARREAALMSYQMLHQFAGVAIGEHIGQTLAALWTAGLSWAILRGGLGPRVFGALGLVIAPLWIVGQVELVRTVIPSAPEWEIAPIAFMAWEAWLLALGAAWIVRGLGLYGAGGVTGLAASTR